MNKRQIGDDISDGNDGGRMTYAEAEAEIIRRGINPDTSTWYRPKGRGGDWLDNKCTVIPAAVVSAVLLHDLRTLPPLF